MRERTGPEQGLEVTNFAAVLGCDQRRDEIRERSRESRTRDVDEHRRPGPDLLGDVEHPHEAALLEAHDVDHELRQRVGVQFEHEVTRKRLDDVSHGAPGVALLGCACEVEHFVRPVTHDRNGEHALAICIAGEQTDEAMFLSGGGPDGHGRHPGGPVDRRDGIGSSDDHALISRGDRRVDHVRVETVSQSILTEPRAGAQHEPIGRPVVDGRSEEHEVPVGKPGEQSITPGDSTHALTHRLEVLDHTLNVVDGTAYVGRQLKLMIRRDPIDLDLRPGLDGDPIVVVGVGSRAGHDRRSEPRDATGSISDHIEHRVNKQVNAEVVTVEDQPYGVDEERHVVGDEHDDRTIRVPSVPVQLGRQHLDEGLAGMTYPAERQVRASGGVDMLKATRIGMVVRELSVVPAEEFGDERIPGPTIAGDGLQVVDDVGHVVVTTHVVGPPVEAFVAVNRSPVGQPPRASSVADDDGQDAQRSPAGVRRSCRCRRSKEMSCATDQCARNRVAAVFLRSGHRLLPHRLL